MLNQGLDKEEAFTVLLGTEEKSGACMMGAGEFPGQFLCYNLSPTPVAAQSRWIGLTHLQSWKFHSLEV